MRPELAISHQLSIDGIPSYQTSSCERFEYNVGTGSIVRYVLRRDGTESLSEIALPRKPESQHDLASEFDLAWLRAVNSPPWSAGAKGVTPMRAADLFCGCGGLSLGLRESARALAKPIEFAFACDINKVALDVYTSNISPLFASNKPIQEIIDGEVGTPPTLDERRLISQLGKIDFVIAGPPCQGHSDLNNHTRRADPKNELVIRVARFVELFRPTWVLIENVPGIRHDKLGSLAVAKDKLKDLGYQLDEALLRADDIGAPQSRKRFFLVASLQHIHSLVPALQNFTEKRRTLGWAIEDLLDLEKESCFDSPATHSAENVRRINYLFDHDLYELPNSERPACHRDRKHSYTSVYGRMHWDQPAPTITTGFGSAGQGRFVHPLKRRTLTPHEAARLQFFPDFFDFGDQGRRQYQSLIGNAVPSKLAYAITLHQLR